MNIRIKLSRLSICLLLLIPLMLAACGGNGADNAKKFMEALEANDRGDAKDAACDEVHDEIDTFFDLIEGDNDTDLRNLECEEDDDEVTCTYESNGDDYEIVFEIEDGKVCGGDIFDEIRSLDDVSAEESTQDGFPSLGD